MDARKFKFLPGEAARRFQNLELMARGIVEGFVSGMHKSPHHGFSVEFAEYREYVPGDPVRHIDWLAYARNDRLVIRQYEQETNLRATVFLDCSKSLDFKSGSDVSKFEYGCYCASCIAYLLQKQQDAVGLVTFDEKIRRVMPPTTGAAGLREMLLHIEAQKPSGKTGLSVVCHEMAEQLPRRSMAILITDLFADPEDVMQAVRHLRHRRHEVLLLHLADRAELDFPYRGLIEFKDLETGELVEVEAELARDAVRENIATFISDWRKFCGDARVDYHLLDTAEPFDRALSACLSRRLSMAKRR